MAINHKALAMVVGAFVTLVAIQVIIDDWSWLGKVAVVVCALPVAAVWWHFLEKAEKK